MPKISLGNGSSSSPSTRTPAGHLYYPHVGWRTTSEALPLRRLGVTTFPLVEDDRGQGPHLSARDHVTEAHPLTVRTSRPGLALQRAVTPSANVYTAKVVIKKTSGTTRGPSKLFFHHGLRSRRQPAGETATWSRPRLAQASS